MQTGVMPPRKKAESGKPEKRTRKYIEVRPLFIPGVEAVEKELGEDTTGAVNALIREGLVARGLWPPKRNTAIH